MELLCILSYSVVLAHQHGQAYEQKHRCHEHQKEQYRRLTLMLLDIVTCNKEQ